MNAVTLDPSEPNAQNLSFRECRFTGLGDAHLLRVRPVILVASDFPTAEQQSTASERTH